MANIDISALKPKESPPAWPKGLLIFSFIIFILTVGAWFALDYWNKNQKNQLNMLDKQISSLRESLPFEKEQEVISFEKKLNNLLILLNNHTYLSKALTGIEGITHPDVYYTYWKFSIEENSLTLEGIAKDQKTFSEAVNGLVNSPDKVKMVSVKDMKTTKDGTVSFSLDVFFQSNFLRF